MNLFTFHFLCLICFQAIKLPLNTLNGLNKSKTERKKEKLQTKLKNKTNFPKARCWSTKQAMPCRMVDLRNPCKISTIMGAYVMSRLSFMFVGMIN